jgi:hypothetical protein
MTAIATAPKLGRASLGEFARDRAERVIRLFKSEFLNSDGLISRSNPPGPRTIFDNFDDIAPFLLWWDAKDFLLEQVGRLSKQSFEPILRYGNLLHAYKIDEYIGGLNVIAKATGDRHARELCDDAVDRCWAYFGDPSVGFAEFYDFDTGKRSPYFSPWAAGLLESFLEIDQHDAEALKRIDGILDLWWSHSYVEQTGLLPFRGSFDFSHAATEKLWARCGLWCGEPPIRWPECNGASIRNMLRRSRLVNSARRFCWERLESGAWSQIMKSNTTPIFLALALYARTGDEKWRGRIERWFRSVMTATNTGNGVCGLVRNGKAAGPPTLVASFIVIDAACDSWWVLGRRDELLRFARDIADACLGWRWENGLIPMRPADDRDHLDGQIDFAVALRRLAELTGEERYFDESIDILRAALSIHERPDGYCTHVRQNGSVVALPQNTIDPKYNGLVLKGLISLATLDRPIYGSNDLHDLFKDR